MSSTEYFTSLGHWSLSHALTTQHLLSLIAITNTLMSVSNASFVPEQERRRKLVRQATHGTMESGNMSDMSFTKQQEQIKTGWSLLSTLHCVLLGEKLATMGCLKHKKLLVELLAVKWQDRCLQVSHLNHAVILNRVGKYVVPLHRKKQSNNLHYPKLNPR